MLLTAWIKCSHPSLCCDLQNGVCLEMGVNTVERLESHPPVAHVSTGTGLDLNGIMYLDLADIVTAGMLWATNVMVFIL